MQDENDHAPQFEKELYKAEVSEAVDPDTQVVSVAATDKDAGANAKIRYGTQEIWPLCFASDLSFTFYFFVYVS